MIKNIVNKTIYGLLMAFYCLRGLWRLVFKFRNQKIYHGGAANCQVRYIGKRQFWELRTAGGIGFEYYEQKLKTYPIWQLGLFNWR